MKLFGMFGRNVYATLPRLEAIIKKLCKPLGLVYRRDKDNDTCFIISNDRAELGFINFRVFARSFDMWSYDHHGCVVIPDVSIYGERWQATTERKIKLALCKMASEAWTVKPYSRINFKWQEMSRQIAEIDAAKTGRPYLGIGDGYAYVSPALAEALWLGNLDQSDFL